MGEKRRVPAPPPVGGSSLLIIFAVLCLTVFALLSLSTAQAHQRLGEASILAVSRYYEADCQAEELFARLRKGELPEGVTERDGGYSYSCPISERQELQVELRRAGDVWQVLRWQAVVVGDEIPEDALGVWDGEVVDEASWVP